MMSTAVQPNKPQADRYDYLKCKVTCTICKKTVKQKKSKSFSSIYALKYHISTSHDREDEIVSGISKAEILNVLEGLAHALELNMLVDLPCQKRKE